MENLYHLPNRHQCVYGLSTIIVIVFVVLMITFMGAGAIGIGVAGTQRGRVSVEDFGLTSKVARARDSGLIKVGVTASVF